MALAAAFAHWWQAHLAALPGRCLIAYSGGVDSTVLLQLAAAQASDRSRLLALHVHHGLQPAADTFLNHCQQSAEAFGVAFQAVRVSVPPGQQGPEAAARRARYRAFIDQLGPDDVLLLAHHQDDQVETVLMRLLRGTGARGFAGMPAERALGAGRLLRPLLDVTRQELLAYASEHQLRWVEDPSNARSDPDRNYLRLRVLPVLAERWPAYRRTVSRAARLIAEELGEAGHEGGAAVRSVYGEPVLDILPLRTVSVAVRGRRVREWLRSVGCQPPPAARLQEFLAQLDSAATDRSPLLQTRSYAVRRHAGQLHLTAALLPAQHPRQPLAAGQALRLAGVGELRCNGILETQASIDFRRGGERCRIAGRYRHLSLKNVLQERAVPPWWRDRVPLLVIDGEICAVARPGLAEPVAGQPGARLLWLPDPGELPMP